MGTRAQQVARATGYILLDTLPTRVAFPAASVAKIVRGSDWEAEPPLPFGALLPIYFSASEPAWVLTLVGPAEPIAVTFIGTIRMNYLQLDSLLPMNAFKYGGFDDFSQLVLADGEPLALVINMDALFNRVAR